ncbi:MAG: 4Fe-4S dicluster domain-containing protein [Ignavibacteriaceae bacterium]|nr:4Fe-4S dicluster domain-containing protein [Ignavibacteriaceae bacterium]
MNFLYLKRTRVLISLFFFLLTSFLFLNINEWFTSQFSGLINYLQFTPSIIKFLNTAGFSTLGFLVIIILTFLFGRIYCSTICPLGTFQDIVSYFSKKISKKRKHFLLKPYSLVKYSILAITIIFVLGGSIYLLILLDPFSIFGKIISNIVRPLLLIMNNILASMLESLGIYWLYPVEIRNIDWISVSVAFIFFISIGMMSFVRGRLYCNLVCPVGTLLGLFSKFSFYKIAIDKANCRSCNLCEKECKAGCIDKKNKIIDFSRCVGCFNCFTACHSDGITYKTALRNTIGYEETESDEPRRAFLKSLLIYFSSLTGISLSQVKIIPKKESTVPINKKFPVSPPGSISIDHFTSSCTACHLCVSACPTQVLQPSFLEYGFLGMMQPRMDYKTSFCNYDCVICSEVCPTGAIQKIIADEKKLCQLGKAVFVKENCIVYTEETACGACSEHCPTKAVDMLEPHKNLKAPKLNNDICIGCGACEFACPTKPYKAIYVEGNQIHLAAKKPKLEKLEQQLDIKEDFPF